MVVAIAGVSVLGGAVLVAAPAANAEPSNIPTVAAAQAQLDGLTVAAEGSMAGYSREEFPHWSTIEGNCSARETVLMRDGDGVVVGSDCYPTSGSWPSPYDNTIVATPSAVDIDHVVPLAEAWRSGADGWNEAERESFANDLTRPQLIAVSASSNRSKGDQDPAQWLPAASYECTYVRMWIAVKDHYDLSINDAEKTALQNGLDDC